MSWSDAATAVGNRKDFSSRRQLYSRSREKEKILESKSSALTPIGWKSGKLRETHSLSAYFFQLLIFFCLQWLQIAGKEIILQQVKGVMVTDAKSLFDVSQRVLHTNGFRFAEKYSILDMLSLFQRLAKGQTITQWVQSKAKLADAWTKHVPNSGRWVMIPRQNSSLRNHTWGI